MLKVSLGIMAYNEEANIGRLLHVLINQSLTYGILEEIIVVASGCTDNTANITRDFMKKDGRIKLFIQPQRKGKASAANIFLANATGDIFVLESGDTIPKNGTIDKLIAPFKDKRVGMTGAHPIPVNRKNTFIGFTVNLMWFLHHKISLITPKLGELVAFRNFVRKIPSDTAVDEASIEAIVRKKGYKLRYVADAIVNNKGPENIMDFIRQRRRILAGHKYLLYRDNYQVSTYNPLLILSILLGEHSWKIKNTVWTLGAISLEMIGRLFGYYDFYIRKKNPFIWDIASSTKSLD